MLLTFNANYSTFRFIEKSPSSKPLPRVQHFSNAESESIEQDRKRKPTWLAIQRARLELATPLWTSRVVKFKKKFFFLFLAKNHYNYMGEGHFRPEQVGTSHFRAPMGPKTAKNGHFGQF